MFKISEIIIFFLLVFSQAAADEKSWIAVLNKKVGVMDVDPYEVVILNPAFYIRVFPFRERGKIPIAQIDLKGGDLSDPYFLKHLIEEQISDVLFKRFLGLSFVNPSSEATKEDIITLFASVNYHYPEVKLVSTYDPTTIDAIAPYISFLITENIPEGYNGDLLPLREEGML